MTELTMSLAIVKTATPCCTSQIVTIECSGYLSLTHLNYLTEYIYNKKYKNYSLLATSALQTKHLQTKHLTQVVPKPPNSTRMQNNGHYTV